SAYLIISSLSIGESFPSQCLSPRYRRNCDTVSSRGREERGLSTSDNKRLWKFARFAKISKGCFKPPLHFCALCGQEFLELPSSTELLGRRKRGIVIGLIGDTAHVLHVFELIIRPDDEHGAGENAIQRAAGDQHAVILSESSIAMIARGHHFIDVRRAAPTLLR